MNETAEGRSIAVIATRIPYIDRRSLSEAWFSALHLASDGPLPPKPAEHRNAGVSAEPPRLSKNDDREEANRATLRAAVSGAASTRPSRAGAEPGGTPLPNARRVRSQATFASARSYAPFRTSLTLGVDGERVALLLRREGATLHVIALCRPAVADLVRRALGCADLSLRSRGESVCSRVEVLPQGVTA